LLGVFPRLVFGVTSDAVASLTALF